MFIKLTIKPDIGYYKDGIFNFECKIPNEFPNISPEFKCIEKIYHPNIDIDGHVCLNILRSDWKPTLTLQLIFAGILHLFLQPNPNDPLNKEAANDLAKFPNQFARHVTNAMEGGYIGDEKFDKVIKGNFDNKYIYSNFY
jgi:ubiquitin-conjugating enzyme E2 M